MANFIVRVELHDASGDDYDTLHDRMLKAGYYRAFIHSDGSKWAMPTAMYDHSDHSSGASAHTVRDEVASIADGIKNWAKKPWLLVVETQGLIAVRTQKLS